MPISRSAATVATSLLHLQQHDAEQEDGARHDRDHPIARWNLDTTANVVDVLDRDVAER